MQLRAALSTLVLTVGVARAQSIDPVPRGFGTPPPAAPPAPAGPATPVPDPSAPATEPPPGAIAPPTDPDNLPPDALPLAIAPAQPTEVLPAPYPRALVERPLVLPDGTIEASLVFAYARSELIKNTTFTALGVSPTVSYAAGRFGLSAGVDVILDVTPDRVMSDGRSYRFELQDEQRLATAYASAWFAPVPDLALRLELVGQALTTDFPRTTTLIAAGYKFRLSPRLAVIPSVATGYSHTTYEEPGSYIPAPRPAFVAAGWLNVQAQAAPLVAVVVHSAVGLRYEGPAEQRDFVELGQPGATLVHEHGLSLVGSVTPNIDLSARANVLLSDQPVVFQVALGFSVRTP